MLVDDATALKIQRKRWLFNSLVYILNFTINSRVSEENYYW